MLLAAKAALSEEGMVVVQVPNLSCLTATHMQFSDITHVTGYTEFSLSQIFDEAGLVPTVVCEAPPFSIARWRPWRPMRHTTLAWRVSRLLHRLAYALTNMGPRPTCYCPTLLMLGRKP